MGSKSGYQASASSNYIGKSAGVKGFPINSYLAQGYLPLRKSSYLDSSHFEALLGSSRYLPVISPSYRKSVSAGNNYVKELKSQNLDYLASIFDKFNDLMLMCPRCGVNINISGSCPKCSWRPFNKKV